MAVTTFSIMASLDSAHCLVFRTEQVPEPIFVFALTWKDGEAPIQLGLLDIISSIIPKRCFFSRILVDGQGQENL